MKRYSNIDCYFIQYKPILFIPTRTEDTLYLRGNERYGTIFRKTIEALQYFLSRQNYTYIVRTNLSSVWDFGNLITYLQDKPRTRFYSGQIGTHEIVPFASGAGIIMSPDVCATLVQNPHYELANMAMDDVLIGKILYDAGIYPVSQPRVDFVSLTHYEEHHDKIPTGTFHYRVKHEDYLGDRMEEPVIMKKIVDSIYK